MKPSAPVDAETGRYWFERWVSRWSNRRARQRRNWELAGVPVPGFTGPLPPPCAGNSLRAGCAEGEVALVSRLWGNAGSPSDGTPSKRCATLDLSRRLRVDGSRPLNFPSIKLSSVAAALAACALACAGVGRLCPGRRHHDCHRQDGRSERRPPTSNSPAPARAGQDSGPSLRMRPPGGGRAIEQTSTERTDYRFPLAIYKPVSAGNVEVVASLQADRRQGRSGWRHCRAAR